MKKLFFLTLGVFIFFQIAAQKNTEIQTSQLPQLTQDYLKDFMPDSKVYKAYKVVDNGEVSYAVGVLVNNDKRILIFDQEGKFVKKGDRRDRARVKQDLQKQQQETGKDQQQMQTKQSGQSIKKTETNQLAKPQQEIQSNQEIKTDPKK